MIPPILETERLILRPHKMDDFSKFQAMFESERSRYMGGPVADREKIWRYFCTDNAQWLLLGFGAWAIDRKSDGEHIGQVALSHPPNYPERELGWLIYDAKHEGQGYAYEASLSARNYAYENLGWDACVSYIDPDNIPSQKLAERLGARIDPNAKMPDEGTLVYRHPSRESLK